MFLMCNFNSQKVFKRPHILDHKMALKILLKVHLEGVNRCTAKLMN